MDTDWDAIIREHGPAVFGAAWRIVGQAADADDVVQEVFLEAFQLHRRQAVRCWSALLRRMAICRALNRVRQRRPTVPLDSLPLADSAAGPESRAVADELIERLREAIARLPEREAEVFCLRYFEELSNQQIAAALAIEAGSVAAALHKARQKLETILRPHLQREKT